MSVGSNYKTSTPDISVSHLSNDGYPSNDTHPLYPTPLHPGSGSNSHHQVPPIPARKRTVQQKSSTIDGMIHSTYLIYI